MAAIGGGSGAGFGAIGGLGRVGQALASSVMTQGIGMAVGAQSKFSWAGVAAAGVGSFVGGITAKYAPGNAYEAALTGEHIGAKLGNKIAATTASGIANAATRTAIDGGDFGDNLRAAIPDIIGQAIGEAFTHVRSGQGQQRADAQARELEAAIQAIDDTRTIIGRDFLNPFPDEIGRTGFMGLEKVDGLDGLLIPIAGGSGGGARPAGPGPTPNRRPGDNRPAEFGSGQVVFPGVVNSPAFQNVMWGLDMILNGGQTSNVLHNVETAKFKHLVDLNIQINPNYRLPSVVPSFSESSTVGRQSYIREMSRELSISTQQLQRDSYSFLQTAVDGAYQAGVAAYRRGDLPDRLNEQEAIGNFVDKAVRTQYRAFLREKGVSFGAGQRSLVQVNSRNYTTDGRYRVPDASIGAVRFDWTLTQKTISTPQIQGYMNSRRPTSGVLIIRPSELGGSYFIQNPQTQSQVKSGG